MSPTLDALEGQATYDDLIRLSVLSERRKAAINRLLSGQLNDRWFSQLNGLIRGRLENIAARGAGFSWGLNARTKGFSKAIDNWTRGLIGDLRENLFSEMTEVSTRAVTDTLKVFTGALDQDLRGVLKSNLTRHLRSSSMGQGRSFSESLDLLEASVSQRIHDVVQLGLTENRSLDDIARAIRGAPGDPRGGLLDGLRRSTNVTIDTSLQFASNLGSSRVVDRNPAVFSGVLWVAMFEISNVCPRCAALDGEEFPQGEGPRPPLHFRCACRAIPIVKGQPKPERETFEQWWQRQPKTVQDELFGPTRATLLRSKKVGFKDLVDEMRRPLTIEELRGLTGEPSKAQVRQRRISTALREREVSQRARRDLRRWVESATALERRAANDWVRGDGPIDFGSMREFQLGLNTNPDVGRAVGHLENLIDRAPTSMRRTIWRSLSNFHQEALDNFSRIGSTIEFDSFQAFSNRASVSRAFLLGGGRSARLRVVTGKGGDLTSLGASGAQEVEVLLNRGSRFRVVGTVQRPVFGTRTENVLNRLLDSMDPESGALFEETWGRRSAMREFLETLQCRGRSDLTPQGIRRNQDIAEGLKLLKDLDLSEVDTFTDVLLEEI